MKTPKKLKLNENLEFTTNPSGQTPQTQKKDFSELLESFQKFESISPKVYKQFS